MNPTDNKWGFYLVLALFFLLAASAFYFSKQAQKPQNTATEASMNSDSSLLLYNDQVKKEFPTFPVYPKSAVVKNLAEDENGHLYSSWQTTDSVVKAMGFYLQNLPQNGWTIEQLPADITNPDLQYLTAVKGELSLQLSIIRNADISQTQIISQFPKPINEEES